MKGFKQIRNRELDHSSSPFGRGGSVGAGEGANQPERGTLAQVTTAFTLAEVLITLGVIGVVAAMTMPTLIAKHREKQTVTAVKVAYSMFSQAFIRIVNESGNLASLYAPDKTQKENSAILMNELSKYLNIIKKCNNTTDTGCMPDIYTSLNGSKKYVNPYERFDNLATAVLSNGMSFWVFLDSSDVGYSQLVGWAKR